METTLKLIAIIAAVLLLLIIVIALILRRNRRIKAMRENDRRIVHELRRNWNV